MISRSPWWSGTVTPDHDFLTFGFVWLVNPLLNKGAGPGSGFFCFGFLSSLPRRVLSFAMLFS
jgi:hypothetical protein